MFKHLSDPVNVGAKIFTICLTVSNRHTINRQRGDYEYMHGTCRCRSTRLNNAPVEKLREPLQAAKASLMSWTISSILLAGKPCPFC